MFKYKYLHHEIKIVAQTYLNRLVAKTGTNDAILAFWNICKNSSALTFLSSSVTRLICSRHFKHQGMRYQSGASHTLRHTNFIIFGAPRPCHRYICVIPLAWRHIFPPRHTLLIMSFPLNVWRKVCMAPLHILMLNTNHATPLYSYLCP